jgi:hypothetical protein
MKTLFLFFGLLLTLSTFAQFEKITGNGNLKKEDRKVGTFNAIASSGSWNIKISYGNSETIQVEGDENILPYLITEVKDGQLQIKQKKLVNFRTKNNLVVYVSLTKLTSLSLSGSGNVNGDGAFTNGGKTDIRVAGSGNVDLSFDHFNEISIALSGSGNVKLKASNSSNNIDAKLSGSGNIDCSNVPCNDAFASISGSGNIKFYAKKLIDARVAGSGRVYYKGDATNINIHSTNKGSVVKM